MKNGKHRTGKERVVDAFGYLQRGPYMEERDDRVIS
jgi:hypothetical protein